MRGILPVLLSLILLISASACQLVRGRPEPSAPEVAAAAERAASEAFLLAQAAKPGARRTASGLVIRETRIGTGPSPGIEDTVTIRYQTRLRDGRLIDDSIRHGEPLTLPLSRMIPCWSEALPQLRAGGAAKLVCPAPLAYGDEGIPPLVAPSAALVYDVELVDVGRALRRSGH